MRAQMLDPDVPRGETGLRPLRAMLADPEPLSRRRLRGLLQSEQELELVGEEAYGAGLVEAALAHGVDLVFVDPELPGTDGFGVARALAGAGGPLVVFVARTPEHAARAFEASAFDYLLKPVTSERLGRTLARARQELSADPLELRRSLLRLLRGIQSGGGDLRRAHPDSGAEYLSRVTVRDERGYLLLGVDEVFYIEADGNYVTFHLERDSHRHRETLTNLESRLDPSRFVRVHRSAILNLDRVQRIEPWYSGDMLAILRNGAKVKISRTYRERLEEVMGGG